MGLFDDLMKKPAPIQDITGGQGQQAQGGSSQGQPVITEQTTIVSQNIPVNSLPQEVASSNNPSQVIEQGGLIIQKSAEESILTEMPIILPKELPEAPAEIVNSASEDDGSLIIVGNVGVNNPLAPQNIPNIAKQEAIQPPVVQPSVAPTLAVNDTATTDTVQSMENFQFNEVKNELNVPSLAQQNESMLSNLFGEPPKVEAPAVVDTTPTSQESSIPVPLFENPIAFINESLEKIDAMIAHIDETHDAKLLEAAGYKVEKERFAGLEAGAYQDGKKMMKERAHAEVMKKYFLDQKKQALQVDSDINRESVETTLTSLSVKNSVNKATSTGGSRKRAHHKSPIKK